MENASPDRPGTPAAAPTPAGHYGRRRPAPVLVVLGPTASGKSDLAMSLARLIGAEILSVDSVQVYRDMDIGTAKPSAEEQAEIRHHMIDVVSPRRDYTVAEFQRAGRRVMEHARARRLPLVMVGGSGLYFRALVDPLVFPPTDPALRAELEPMPHEALVTELLNADSGAADHVDLANPRRVRRAVEVLRLGGGAPSARASRETAAQVRSYRPLAPFLAVGLDPGDGLADRIERRAERMMRSGLLEEVAALEGRMGRNASRAVGYRQLVPVVRGELDPERGKEDTIRATLALARRQRTYFGKDPRIRWLRWDDDPAIRRRQAVRSLRARRRWSF